MDNNQSFSVKPQNEPEYSPKKRKLAIFLSVFFANLGIPYYYVGKPLLGFIASIPFLAIFIICFAIDHFTVQDYILGAKFYCLISPIINIGSAVLFAKRIIRDKNGKILK